MQALHGVQRGKDPLQTSDPVPPAFVHPLIPILSPGVGSPQPSVPKFCVWCCHILSWTQSCPALPFWRLELPSQGSLVGKVTQGELGQGAALGSRSSAELPPPCSAGLTLLSGAGRQGEHKHQSGSTPSCHEHLRMGSPISWSPLPLVDIPVVLPSSGPCSSPSSCS